MPGESSAADTPLFCDRCTTRLHPGRGDFFEVRIEAVADPTPPDITDDLEHDPRQAIQEAVDQASQFSERELMDQVYRRLIVYLCGPCYRRWIENPTSS